MFFNFIKNTFFFFIFSNLFVALCALALFLSSEIILETNNFNLSIFIFSSTVFIYNFQRIVRIKRGLQHTRKTWILRNQKTIMFLTMVFLISSFYYFLTFNLITKFTIMLCGLVSLFYPFGLRNVPFLKIFLISLVWATTTFLLLVLENQIALDLVNVIHFLSRFLFVLAITIPFDIRDIPFDKTQLKTLPVFFGEKKARFLAHLTLLVSFMIYSFLFLCNIVELNFIFTIAVSYLIAAVLIFNSKKQKTEIYFSFGVESASIIFYLVLVISSCIL